MGKGEELGRELRHWIAVDRWLPASGPALANRLIDLLGEQDTLKAPLRDLAGQPQFLQLLRQPQPASPAAVEALCSLLARTYAPAVLAELQDLIQVATGLRSPGQGAGPASQPAAAIVPAAGDIQPDRRPAGRSAREAAVSRRAGDAKPLANPPFPAATAATAPQARPPSAPAPGRDAEPGATNGCGVQHDAAASLTEPNPPPHGANSRWGALAEELIALGPGLALGFSVSLVLSWAASQLDRALLDRWGWSGGVTLALTLLVLQIGSSGPLRRCRRHALLNLPSSDEPRLAWRWITSPWFHARGGEALTHVLLLLILLGPSPLPLNQVVLRYSLTVLATEALAVLSARLTGMTQRRWGGAAGPVAALIGLAACLSLLHWRELGFRLGWPEPLSVPAWVLLVVYASLQLAWQLPRRSAADASRPGDRLWSSTWWWGSVLGAGWGLLSWVTDAIGQALQHSGGR
ncbi:MAG: rhomboid family intramembrane serine protease [Cyanobium sp.]